MTTDITELAQRMRTAAEKLGAAQWQIRNSFSGTEVIVKGSLEKGAGCVSFQPVAADIADTKTARAIALFGPANILALVEALEKAQQHIARQEQILLNQDESLSIRRGELEAAQQERDNWRTSFDNERFRADKLKAHIDEMTEERTASITELSRIIQKEVKAKREAEKRIAELESRTVKLPAERFCPAEYAGSQLWSETEVWNKAITACADALRADGIKVEAE
ncbi:TPA: ead/Ea22-like family protein [Klebsiella pneumoniae subsp. pneumoniae]|nr:ead/Ea22-like family protein [Klebsiella pneumoniae subsp. pneumoniae]